MGDPDFELITKLSIQAAESAMDAALNVIKQIENPRDRVIATATAMGVIKGRIDASMERANTAQPSLMRMTSMMLQAGEALAKGAE
jgi:hypothetical protein